MEKISWDEYNATLLKDAKKDDLPGITPPNVDKVRDFSEKIQKLLKWEIRILNSNLEFAGRTSPSFHEQAYHDQAKEDVPRYRKELKELSSILERVKDLYSSTK